MDLNVFMVLFHAVARSIAGGAAAVVLFLIGVVYLRYSTSKDRVRRGHSSADWR
jgi:hypothetical protein